LRQENVILFAKKIVKKSPKLKFWLGCYVEYFYQDYSGLKVFLKKNKDKRFKVNIGSGSALDRHDFINVDISEFPGVHVRGDTHHLPFKDNSIDSILCEQMMEHIQNPKKMVSEFLRILAPKGEIYITAPFVYPYHGAPIDMNRWTLDGLKHFMEGFQVHMAGVTSGPTTALVETFHEWISILFSFNSERIHQVVYLLILPFVKPFKVIDLILLNKFKMAHRLAGVLYFYGKKPSGETQE